MGQGILDKSTRLPGALFVTPADQGLDLGVILAKALGALGSHLSRCGKQRRWNKRGLIRSFPLQSRTLGFSGTPVPLVSFSAWPDSGGS